MCIYTYVHVYTYVHIYRNQIPVEGKSRLFLEMNAYCKNISYTERPLVFHHKTTFLGSR